MPNTTVDSLQIEVQATAATAAREIDKLTASLQKLQGATQLPGLDRTLKQLQGLGKAPNLSGMERELARLEKQAVKDGDALLELQNKLETLQQFRGVGNKLTIADTDSQIKQVEQAIKELSASIDHADTRIRTLRKSIQDGMAGASAPIERAAEKISQVAQPNVSLDEGIRKAAASCDDLARSAQKAQKSVENTANSTERMAESARKVQGSSAGFDRVTKSAKRVEGAVKGAANGAEQMGRAMETAGNRGASSLDKLENRLKRMAVNFVFYRVLRNLINSIGDSLGRMAVENTRVNATLSKIVSSLQYVADALGAAIYPIIVALEPVITTILDGLAEILNFIAQIVAFFTGQDYVLQAKKQQIDYAESLNGTASSMGSVSKAAKELKNNLIGIDELNVIGKQSSGGGENGGGLGDLRFEEIPNKFKLPETIKSPVWDPNPIPAPQFEPVTLPQLSTATLQSPVWSPALVPAPAFEPFPVPELAGQKIPSPEWEPQIIQAPVFETLKVPEYAGRKLLSPEWVPDFVPAPVFEEVPVPELAGKTLRSPAWEPSLILAPTFEALTLPEWALAPLPVPEWAQNPVLSPAIDSTATLAGLSQMEQAFSTSWADIKARVSEGVAVLQEKLQYAKQTILDFASATQANFAAWVVNVKENFSNVTEFIPTVTTSALQKSASTVVSYLSSTADGFAAWGTNVATNFRAAIGYLPGAAAEGLSAAGESVVGWINSTSDSFASWGGNLVQTGAKAISGFVQNFVSGLASAWDNFVGFMRGIGEKISNWWSANKSWAAPVGAVALAGVGIGAFVLSGGAAGLAASIPTMAKVALPAMAFASGGVVRSPTLGLIGEYPGARSNPEIVTPQNLLTDIIQKENNSGDIIQAIREATLEAASRIVDAIHDQDFSVSLDGKKLMQAVERQQRERGANIMADVL